MALRYADEEINALLAESKTLPADFPSRLKQGAVSIACRPQYHCR